MHDPISWGGQMNIRGVDLGATSSDGRTISATDGNPVGNEVHAAHRAKSERFHVLDLWRAGLLIYGVVVHACGMAYMDAHLTPANGLGLLLIFQASGGFRMEAFFFVAGFLAAKPLIEQRHGYLRRRFSQLLVPALTVVVALMPIANWISGRTAAAWGDLYHAWFLVALAETTLVAWLFRPTWLPALLSHKRMPLIWLIALTIGAIILRLLTAYLTTGVSPSTFPSTSIRSIYYMLYFGIGMCLFQSADLRAYFGNGKWLAVFPVALLLFCLAYSHSSMRLPHPHLLTKITVEAAKCLLGISACITIIASMQFKLPHNRYVKFISAGAYTVYMLNLPLVMIVYSYLPWHSASALLITSVIIVVTALCYLFHMLIARSRIALFLLNGVMPSRLKR